MTKYQPMQVEMTPQLLPPTMLKLTWSVHLLPHRDHALWRVEARVGHDEDLVGLAIHPCPALADLDDLDHYARRAVTLDLDAARGYIYPRREPFPGPPRGGAPAA